MRAKLYPILLIAWLLLTGCPKKNVGPLSQLPPETQEGKGTFGCLVNGEAFLPKRGGLSGPSPLGCAYQYIFDQYDKGWFFQLVAHNFTDEKSVGVFTDSLQIEQGIKYQLDIPFKRGTTYGRYQGSGLTLFDTNGKSYAGELWIKKFDPINQIVSGTFWFDAVNKDGEKVEIREGRFDMRFTW